MFTLNSFNHLWFWSQCTNWEKCYKFWRSTEIRNELWENQKTVNFRESSSVFYSPQRNIEMWLNISSYTSPKNFCRRYESLLVLGFQNFYFLLYFKIILMNDEGWNVSTVTRIFVSYFNLYFCATSGPLIRLSLVILETFYVYINFLKWPKYCINLHH